MSKKNNSTLKILSYYFFNEFFLKAFSFIILPIITSQLTSSEYGVYSLFFNFVSLFSVLVIMNVNSSLSSFLYDPKVRKVDIIKNVTLMSYFIICISYVFLIFYKTKIATMLNIRNDVFILILIYLPSEVYYNRFYRISISRNNSNLLFKINIIKKVVLIAGFLFSYFTYELSLNNILICYTISNYSIFFLATKISKKDLITGKISMHLMKDILFFSISMLFYSLNGFIFDFFDKILINKLLGNYETGIYSFAYRISILSYLISIPLINTWVPKFNTSIEKGFVSSKNSFQVPVLIMTIAVIVLVITYEFIGRILTMNLELLLGLSIVPYIILGYYFLFLSQPINKYLLYKRKSRELTFITLLASITNIILNVIFIPKFGFQIAAITTMISYILMFIINNIVFFVQFKYFGYIKLYRFLPIIIILVIFRILSINDIIIVIVGVLFLLFLLMELKKRVLK